jgi:hypothetical protein
MRFAIMAGNAYFEASRRGTMQLLVRLIALETER